MGLTILYEVPQYPSPVSLLSFYFENIIFSLTKFTQFWPEKPKMFTQLCFGKHKKVKSTLEVLKEFGGDINQRCHSGFIPIQEAVLNRSDPAAVVSAL